WRQGAVGAPGRIGGVGVRGPRVALLTRLENAVTAAGDQAAVVGAAVVVVGVAVVALLAGLHHPVAAARHDRGVDAGVGGLVAGIRGADVGVGAGADRAGEAVAVLAGVRGGAEQPVAARRAVGPIRVEAV